MERKPTFTGRHLLAHLGDATRPCVILDQHCEVVFANQAAAECMGVELSALEGYCLTNDANTSKSMEGRLHIAELQSWSETVSSIKDGESCLLESKEQTVWQYWLAIGFQDAKKALTLFTGVQKREPLLTAFRPTEAWQLEQSIRNYWYQLNEAQYDLRRQLSLVGPNTATRLALQQTQLAIRTNVPCTISGEAGCGTRDLAEFILHRRRGTKHALDVYTVISCGLMDVKLLQELCDLLEDRYQQAKRSNGVLPAVLIERLDLLPIDCLVVLKKLVSLLADSSIVVTIEHAESLSNLQQDLAEFITQLSVIRTELLPIKDRLEDLPVLCQQILNRLAKESQTRASPSIHEEAMRAMHAYAWPRNTEELVLALTTSFKASQGTEIRLQHLPLAIRSFPSSKLEQIDAPIELDNILLETERNLIVSALARFQGNRTNAARMLGISRSKLLRRIEQLGINTSEGKSISTIEAKASSIDSDVGIRLRSRKTLSTEELIELTSEEIDDEPIFREIDED